jgi:hypothetical protein
MGILWSYLQPLCLLVVSRAALDVFHRLGWFPDRQLADLTMSILSDETAYWVVLAFLTLLLWLAMVLIQKRLLTKPTPKIEAIASAAQPPIPAPIPLLEAANQVYEATRDTTAAEMARGEGDSNDTLIWYCIVMCMDRTGGSWVKLSGTKPPSRVREQINIERPMGAFRMKDGSLVLTGIHDDTIIGADLMVEPDGIQHAISMMLGLESDLQR